MADDQLSILVDHYGTKKRFKFSQRSTVREALETMGKEYKVPMESIYLLYQSIELAEHSSLGVNPVARACRCDHPTFFLPRRKFFRVTVSS